MEEFLCSPVQFDFRSLSMMRPEVISHAPSNGAFINAMFCFQKCCCVSFLSPFDSDRWRRCFQDPLLHRYFCDSHACLCMSIPGLAFMVFLWLWLGHCGCRRSSPLMSTKSLILKSTSALSRLLCFLVNRWITRKERELANTPEDSELSNCCCLQMLAFMV